MKKTVFSVLSVMVIGIPCAFAQLHQKHSADIATTISYIRYKEPAVMKERGMMYGIAGSYFYHDACMLGLQARGAFGQVDYKGSGTINDVDDYLLEVRGLAGYDFPVSEWTVLTPYTGVGVRYLEDDLGGSVSTTGASGYKRESRYYYSPFGVEGVTAIKHDWSLGYRLEYDLFWWGRQDSQLSDVAGLQDSKNRQNKGYGSRASIKLRKASETIAFTVEPYVIYWSIKSSNVSSQATEPKNNSLECGVRLAVGF